MICTTLAIARSTCLLGAVLTLSLSAIGCIQVVQLPGIEEKEVRTPKPFLAMEDPQLEATDYPGLFRAPSLDASCYFYKPDKYWFRFTYNKWFQAFRWDGAWFELLPQDIPKYLKDRAQVELEPTKKEKLKDTKEKLEELDREDRLRELEEKMKQLEQEDKAKQAEPQAETTAPAPQPAPSKPAPAKP